LADGKRLTKMVRVCWIWNMLSAEIWHWSTASWQPVKNDVIFIESKSENFDCKAWEQKRMYHGKFMLDWKGEKPREAAALQQRKLEKCAVILTCRPTPGESQPIPIAKVKTLTQGLGLGFDLLSACRGPTMYYMSTDFGANISNRSPFRAWTNRQTDIVYIIQPAWVNILTVLRIHANKGINRNWWRQTLQTTM